MVSDSLHVNTRVQSTAFPASQDNSCLSHYTALQLLLTAVSSGHWTRNCYQHFYISSHLSGNIAASSGQIYYFFISRTVISDNEVWLDLLQSHVEPDWLGRSVARQNTEHNMLSQDWLINNNWERGADQITQII